MTNEKVQSSIYTNGCNAEAVIPDASRYSPLATVADCQSPQEERAARGAAKQSLLGGRYRQKPLLEFFPV
ncbi:hypothetical protein OUZ56_009516 [Daphnia magna]|uniref:Uncharacterized protein n=1 Tax=Daphnia magna TaxID=35525 RepID=A0ABR0AGD6_9CRUS|nr:hypothetical protein OUZ56_009516 [Daphnia magna]